MRNALWDGSQRVQRAFQGKTSEKNVRSKHEGKWSYLKYDGKIQEQLEQGGDRIASAFPKGHLAPHH